MSHGDPAALTALYEDCEKALASSGAEGLEALKGSSLLVTGGSGFVGLWLATLAAYLNDRRAFGLRVTLTARSAAGFAERAPHLAHRKDIAFAAADVRQFIDLPGDLEWIVHGAGVPDSRFHATNPIETASVIAQGTERVLRVAEQAARLKGVLHLSSALVYGRSGRALKEGERGGGLEPSDVSNAYAEAKRYSETLCAAFRSQGRLPVAIARPFTFIGPFQALTAPWAANTFLHAALTGQPLKILGDGQAERGYLYGADMAVLLLKQLLGGRAGEVFNLGHPEPVALRELADVVVKASGRSLEIRANTGGGAGAGASAHLVADMSLSERRFGFHPAFSPAEAVARTLEWHGLARRR